MEVLGTVRSILMGIFPALRWFLIASTILLLSKVLVKAIYNVYFHPLSKFPGPKSAAATPIPFVWRLLNGRWLEWTTTLHEKYGEVVRTHPDELSFIGPSAWQDIYCNRPQLPKPKIGVLQPPSGVPSLATTDNIEDHARQRRIIGHALSDRALREQEYILKNYTDHLIQRLHELVKESQDGKTTVTDIARWYTYTTFDTIGDLEFGESFHSLDNREEHPWVSFIFNGLKYGMILTAFHHFPPLKAEWLVPRSIRAKATEHSMWAHNRIEKRLQQESDRPDFMHYVLENKDGDKGMSREEINSNATLLILAGSDTSATTCTSVTWFLVKNPPALQKLQQEVRSSFKSFDEITVATAAKLPYLHAVIQEASRLHPTGPISVPRHVDRPVTISGHPVPVGVRVGIPQKTAYRSPINFIEPLRFQPERWLKDAPSKFDADRKDVFEPFMVGPRNCLGKSLAWAEMNLILCKVIWSFDLALGEGNKEDWSDQKVWLLHERLPLYVKITPRAA